nr:beta-chimaerin-like [Ciona intestinalis]|eukprot:XP_018671064.1 beta-chimaerin-like [Ciona intestinalis]
MGYSPSKPARRQTCQKTDIQSESPWQPRDDMQQTPTPRTRSTSSARKRPPLTLHNPNYNDVIGTDVTSQQKDKDNKQENAERTRNDVITHKEDMNPAYRVTRQGTIGEQISPDDVTPKNVDQTAPPVSKDKKRITKVSSVPDVPAKSRPIARRATTNDLLSKAKNGRMGQPSVKEKSSPQIDEKVSHGKLKKTVTSPAMQRSVTSPTSRHRGATSPSKKSPSKVSRTKCLLAQQYEKEHHYKSHTYRGLQWCEYCGNFMWGIIQQGVQCVDCGLNVHKQCAKLVPNDCQPALKHIHHVFGVDLTTLVKLHSTQRPLVVDMCIAEIEKRGMDSEGIYRIPGFHDDVIELKAAFDQLGTEVNMTAYEDVNTIAGALKLYLRELPVPLLPYRLYSRFINAAKISHENGKLDAIRMALSATPGAHFETIKYLIQHLGRVSERSNENQMSAHNLGIVFGPTLLRAPENDVNQRYNLNDTQFQQEAIASMIGYRQHLFGLG